MKRIDGWLPKAIEQPEVLKAARAGKVFERWPEVVGDLLAAKSSPDQFDHGILWVTAAGSAWAQELRLNQEVILERLNSFAGERLFTGIRVSNQRRREDTP
jgi:predicted nucleic acid-binding Zn ribbon protein